MKKFLILLLSMATVISTAIDEPQGNVVYAASGPGNVGTPDDNADRLKRNTERFKAEFAYEMAQITASIVAAPAVNIENFKVDFAYATAQVTAKMMPLIPDNQKKEFAYEMARITTKIISDQNLEIENAKAEIAYEIAQLTTKIITNADELSAGNKAAPALHNGDSGPQTDLLRKNSDIEQKAVERVNVESKQEVHADTGYITPETYNGLVNDLMQVSDRSKNVDNKVNIDGEIRYHYAFNRGSENWDNDSSGIRTRIGFDTQINKEWSFNGMLESEKDLVDYNNEFKLSYWNLAGKWGSSTVRVGSFGYFMAEGNIYDSGFKGLSVDSGERVKYTVSYGETDYTKKTFIATARYKDFDYNLEAGVYHYQVNDSGQNQNTIWNLAGNYNFSNFGVGAMLLDSTMKDSKGASNGYVFSFNYGDLKTYRRGTYDVFAKYYNQPQGTYIMHGMNGLGGIGVMQGFTGYALGTHYTFAKNFVAGIEYYDLTDKITGEKGDTWWSDVTYYF